MLDKRFHFTWLFVQFLTIHLGCFFVFVVGIDRVALMLCAALFLVRGFGITAGYHRYFSHRSYKTGRFFQFCLALLGGMSAQKGVLWWAAHHRHHHRHSDTEQDIHSAKRQGFYWSHIGWALSAKNQDYDPRLVKDLLCYPELVWLDRYHFFPTIMLGFGCYLVYGWMGLVWGLFVSTTILYHITSAINSFCHIFGTRRYETGESSRNSWWLALLTLGEGWHNNHHYHPHSSRQGFFWWEIDLTYYVLKILSFLKIIRDIKEPPASVLCEGITAKPLPVQSR